MKPPEPMICFPDEWPIGTARAANGHVYLDGRGLDPEGVRDVTKYLLFLADAAEKQRDYENEQAQPKPLEK